MLEILLRGLISILILAGCVLSPSLFVWCGFELEEDISFAKRFFCVLYIVLFILILIFGVGLVTLQGK